MEDAKPVIDALNDLEEDSSIESSALLEAYNEILADVRARIEALNEDITEHRG